MFYDVNIINCHTDAAIMRSGGAATFEAQIESELSEAYARKFRKHGADVERVGGRFLPLVVSVSGVWNGDSLRELRALSDFVAARTGQQSSSHWSSFITEISCALARGNAGIINAAQRSLGSRGENDEGERPAEDL